MNQKTHPKKIIAIQCLAVWLTTIILGALCSAHAVPGDATISAPAGPWPITIRTCDHDAGAVCSLTWRDREFINDFDHGRQLQSASSFDGQGEGFNPTEAGGEYNGPNPSPSSSVLRAIRAENNVLATETNMAFWKPIHHGQVSSGHILKKRIQIGFEGLAHVIEYRTEFKIPANETHQSGVFEVVTGYMPPEFSNFWTLDVKSECKRLRVLSDSPPGEQNLPVIFSTPDGGWAMGIYSPDSPQAAWPTTGYGRGRFSDTVKWNNVFRIANPSGVYAFRSYVIVGSLQNVTDSMEQLYNIVH